MLNVPGTSLNVEKRWKPTGTAKGVEEVYIKIWRREYGTSQYYDYLAVISQEMSTMGNLSQDHFKTSGNEVFDAVNYRLILKKENDWKAVIDKVDLFPRGTHEAQYEYLIEEVGYKDRTGNYNNNLSQFNISNKTETTRVRLNRPIFCQPATESTG